MPPPQRAPAREPAAAEAGLLRTARRIPAQVGPAGLRAAEVAAPVPRAETVLALQASAGNAAVARLLEARALPAAGEPAAQPSVAAAVTPAAASSGGGLLGRLRRGASAALDWARRHVLEPLGRLGAAAVSAIGRFGGAALRGVAGVRPRWGDLLQPLLLGFRAAVAARRSVTAEAVADERRERQAAAAANGVAADRDPGPGPIERLDEATRQVEALADGPMGVADELAEGAILGDFKDDPSGWNTVGQIAMGFVPYAGQVADVRDTVAVIRKLHASGWKDPWEWVNLGLTVVAWVPGLGDLVKGIGKGAVRWLRNAAPALLRRGQELWGAVRRAVPRLLGSARAFGGRLLSGARRLGGRLLSGARGLGSRAAATGRRLLSGARGLLSRAGSTVGGLLGRARAAGSQVLSRGRALIGRATGAVRGLAHRVLGSAGSMVRQAFDRTRAVQARLRQLAADVRSRAATGLAAAKQWATSTVSGLRAHAAGLLQRARAAGASALRRATSAGGDLLRAGADRVRRFVTEGLPRLKDRALGAVRAGLRGLRDRVGGFFRRHVLERLRRPIVKGRGFVDDLVRRLTGRKDALSLLSERRRRHILYGDATGGGHLWPALPGKTAFPRQWDAQRVLREVSDIATDPHATWVHPTGPPYPRYTKKGKPVRWTVTAERGGIKIRVIVEPDGEGIITAFPTS